MKHIFRSMTKEIFIVACTNRFLVHSVTIYLILKYA
jgi:hypothetical protein